MDIFRAYSARGVVRQKLLPDIYNFITNFSQCCMVIVPNYSNMLKLCYLKNGITLAFCKKYR